MSDAGPTAAKVTSFSDLTFSPRFEYGHMANVTEVVGAGDGARLGAGFARFRSAEIPWTVHYEEVILVLEGELTVRLPDRDLTAGPMQTIWLPNPTTLTYVAESALVFYAIHPTTWAEDD